MKIVHVPIEKIPTRYTADWIEQFEREFKKAGVEYITVVPTTEQIAIKAGSVLDAFGTNIFKLKQLEMILTMIETKQITEDDVIFFADLWFPGIESLFYVRNITGINFKIAGIFHAGTWDPYDFTSRTNMRDWGQHIELGWLHGIDMIFVATQWHKDLIVMNSGDFDDTKIFVTGIPFYAKELREKYPVSEKENIVIFPHRCDPEKQPDKFDKLAKKYPQWQFVKTLEATKNREEYFSLLAKSKVMISFAQQETFGYSTVEAMALGNYVIVPNKLSYRETVPEEFRYKSEKEIEKMLEDFMSKDTTPEYPELEKWESSVAKMLRVINVKMKEYSLKRQQYEQQERQTQMEQELARQERIAKIEQSKEE